MTDWAVRLDRWLGSRLRRLVKGYKRAHPETNCRVWSHTLGQATVYQGYTVGASFQMPGGTVQLVVDLGHLDSRPGFETAYVVWMEPVWEVEVEWPPSIIAGQQTKQRRITKLKEGLPKLLRALKEALRRGRPPVRPPVKNLVEFSAPERPAEQSEAREEPGADDAAVREAVLASLPGRFTIAQLGFAVDRVRRYQAQLQGWKLPLILPAERLRLSSDEPGAHGWREVYRREPLSQGRISLSRVVYASTTEAFLRVRRSIGFGDSGYWIGTTSGNAAENSRWQDRWGERLARELLELVRLEKRADGWQVADSINLLSPVPGELQMAAVRSDMEADLGEAQLSCDTLVDRLDLGYVQLRTSGKVVYSDVAWFEVDAILKDARTFRFFVLPAFSVHSNDAIGPYERLIVVDSVNMSNVARAIEAWLALSGSTGYP